MFINVGAMFAESGRRVETKKALKEALTENPQSVVFDKTSLLDRSILPNPIKVSDLMAGVKLSVCGPNPFQMRNWYATVEVKNGQVKVA